MEQKISGSPPGQDDMRPGVRDDGLSRRLAWGLGISLLANIVVWRVASEVVHSHIITPPIPITIQRIILPPKVRHVIPKPRHVVKPPPPKPIVKSIPKPVVPPPHHVPQPPRRPTPHQPPPAAHNRVITAPGPPVHSTEHTVLPGGNAGPGKPVEHQYNGNGTDTNVKPPPPAPPAPKPESPPPPKPEPPAPPPPPKPAPPPPPPPPPPAGLTQDAEMTRKVDPEIPDDLKSETFKTHVLVKFTIHADGSATSSLLTSSGNADIDQLVIAALRQCRWKPALQDGKPVDSSSRIRYEFEVN